jgi:hypothetical protein
MIQTIFFFAETESHALVGIGLRDSKVLEVKIVTGQPFNYWEFGEKEEKYFPVVVADAYFESFHGTKAFLPEQYAKERQFKTFVYTDIRVIGNNSDNLKKLQIPEFVGKYNKNIIKVDGTSVMIMLNNFPVVTSSKKNAEITLVD